jgi:hypothetical protein
VRLVYYSLANSPGTGLEQQWIQSIRSLRRYNSNIAVCLFLFNGAAAELLSEADRHNVRIEFLGDYAGYLQREHLRGSVLALYPTFHKFLALAHNPFSDANQVLYLDCDTFFFDDVEVLFELYAACDWYAREEPMSRRSHYAYNTAHIDEGVLEHIARHEGLRPIIPFNSGVCLLNHGVWHALQRIRIHYLDLAWRLLSGRELHGNHGMQHDPQIQAATLEAITDFDRSRMLLYPSANTWIIEQIALWLALGHLPQMTQGFLSRDHILQGGEFREVLRPGRRCVLAHYYSTLEEDFFSAVSSLPY